MLYPEPKAKVDLWVRATGSDLSILQKWSIFRSALPSHILSVPRWVKTSRRRIFYFSPAGSHAEEHFQPSIPKWLSLIRAMPRTLFRSPAWWFATIPSLFTLNNCIDSLFKETVWKWVITSTAVPLWTAVYPFPVTNRLTHFAPRNRTSREH